MFVCPSTWNKFLWSLILGVFRKSIEKIQVPLKSDKNNGYFTRRLFTFMTISRQILFRMRNLLDKGCTENQNTFYVQWLVFENLAVYEIMSKNVVEPEGPQQSRAHTSGMLDKQGYTRVRACTRPRSRTPTRVRTHGRAHTQTHTHKYVILIAFLRQWFANALQYYLIRTLPVLYCVLFSWQ